MIYVPFKHLKPGMVLARDVVCGFSFFALVVNGQRLTEFAIERLREYGVPGAYIESIFCADVEIESFIDPEVKQKTISELKTVYDGYAGKKELSSSSLRAIADVAQNLLMQVLSKDECLFNIIEMKTYDTYTYTHSMYVGILSVMIGIQQKMTRSELNDIAICGLLHDIGKMNISRDIVNKPGQLLEQEFEIMKTHPMQASSQLWPYQKFSAAIIAGIESHHEKYNGTGYPRGLAGKDIPLYGRILALADVYDALTSERPYRRAWMPHEAIEYMMGGADSHFDMDLLKSFLRVVAAYPVGTVVKLSNDVIGVVVKNYPDSNLRPLVRIIQPPELIGQELNLSQDRGLLNVTVSDVLGDSDEMPDTLFAQEAPEDGKKGA